MISIAKNEVRTFIAEWQTANGTLLSRRGTIHDMGPTLTHRKDVCWLRFREDKTVTEAMCLTKHSDRAIDRYITSFRQVFTCKTNGLTIQDTALAAKLSPRLVEECHRLFDEYAVTNTKFDALLKAPKTR